MRQLGAAVRERRLRLGQSQAVLAERCDLDRLYLSRIERGLQNPSMLVVMRLALELEVGLGDLLRDVAPNPAELRTARPPGGRRRRPDGKGA